MVKNKIHFMKKLLSILCVAVITLTAASCKKETVVAPNNNITSIKTVKATDWTTFNTTSKTVDLSVPELDSYANEHYAVLAYIAYGDNAPWEQIPEVFDGSAFSFTHNPGHVTLYVQNSNGTGTPIVPDNAYVKIVIIESN
jgi:hypothetical protein